jgi:hypothetical protein
MQKEDSLMTSVAGVLGSVTVGEGKVFKNLTVFPLAGAESAPLDYLTLGRALELGVARVVEVSTGGRVPELRFENTADLPVLILDGEELVGAKQNRTVNLTMLVPAGTTIDIPVTCVEAGRWSYASREFEASDHVHFARGRAQKAASVSCSMSDGAGRHADQSQVWAEISAKSRRMAATSATQAMAAIFDRHRSSVEDYVAALTPAEEQTGAIFAIGPEVVGLDFFDRSSTLVATLPKLVRSYAIDALETPVTEGCDQERASVFLRTLGGAPVESFPAVGLGSDLRLRCDGLVGGGLEVEGVLVHLAAFAVEAAPTGCRREACGLAPMRSRREAFRRR